MLPVPDGNHDIIFFHVFGPSCNAACIIVAVNAAFAEILPKHVIAASCDASCVVSVLCQDIPVVLVLDQRSQVGFSCDTACIIIFHLDIPPVDVSFYQGLGISHRIEGLLFLCLQILLRIQADLHPDDSHDSAGLVIRQDISHVFTGKDGSFIDLLIRVRYVRKQFFVFPAALQAV